jgi:hypothetical protein
LKQWCDEGLAGEASDEEVAELALEDPAVSSVKLMSMTSEPLSVRLAAPWPAGWSNRRVSRA